MPVDYLVRYADALELTKGALGWRFLLQTMQVSKSLTRQWSWLGKR